MKHTYLARTISLVITLITNTALSQPIHKPNIIFILADDLGYGDLGCFGSKIIHTPNLDKLATEGIRLTQFYSGSTVCAPSRNSLMTGKHTGHAYIRGNGEIPLRKQDVIMPEVLKQYGYTTGMFGKWGLGDIGTSGSPNVKGWDLFFGFLHHIEAHYQAPATAWEYKKGMKSVQRIGTGFGGLASDEFNKQALNFIKSQPTTNPFFVYFSIPMPHAELYAPKDAMKRYQDDKGKSIFTETPYEGSHYGGQNQPRAAYAAMVTRLDDYIGQILTLLKEKGIVDNTLIIFSSDNGTHKEGGRTLEDNTFMNSSGGLRGIKRDLYEGGIRVPTIIAGAGLPKNINREGYGAFWDILPTLIDMIGGKKIENIDGISQWNYWKTGQNWQSRPLYWEFFEGGFFQAVRSDEWKYIKSVTRDGKTTEELYNLKEDKSESQNMASSNDPQLKKMATLCQSLHTKSEHPIFRLPSEK